MKEGGYSPASCYPSLTRVLLQALIHSKMRLNAHALLSALEDAQTGPNNVRSLV